MFNTKKSEKSFISFIKKISNSNVTDTISLGKGIIEFKGKFQIITVYVSILDEIGNKSFITSDISDLLIINKEIDEISKLIDVFKKGTKKKKIEDDKIIIEKNGLIIHKYEFEEMQTFNTTLKSPILTLMDKVIIMEDGPKYIASKSNSTKIIKINTPEILSRITSNISLIKEIIVAESKENNIQYNVILNMYSKLSKDDLLPFEIKYSSLIL